MTPNYKSGALAIFSDQGLELTIGKGIDGPVAKVTDVTAFRMACIANYTVDQGKAIIPTGWIQIQMNRRKRMHTLTGDRGQCMLRFIIIQRRIPSY
jgi:hypothetical protein